MIDNMILDIKPYNEIHYHNCFLHAFYPVVMYFERAISSYILSEYSLYDIDNVNILHKKRLYIKERDNILKAHNIIENKSRLNNDIINNIRNSISDGKPVIVYIDCYYEDIRPDSYKLIHQPHLLLVHGYDDENNNMYIIEHNYVNSLQYENRIITYKSLEESYYNGLKLGAGNTYYEYQLNGEIYYDIKEIDRQNIENYKNNILNIAYTGLNNIKVYSEEILQNNKEYFINNIDDIISNITDIIEINKNNSIIASTYLKVQEKILKLYEIVNNDMMIIRGMCLKSKMTNNYDSEKIMNISKRIYDLYNDEKRLTTELLIYLEKDAL